MRSDIFAFRWLANVGKRIGTFQRASRSHIAPPRRRPPPSGTFATMAPEKLRGRAFYESIGSPKYVVAPMVDQSEFAWRMLTRSFMPPEKRTSVLAYSPMLHAKLFADGLKYRSSKFEALKPSVAYPASAGEEMETERYNDEDLYLDGNPKFDRPLFVQFCANDPDALLKAAKAAQPFCDAVDLNLGCPQGIAKRGHYGAFLQEDWDLIYKLINTLHRGLTIPVTAKMRVLETKEKTLEYAKMILSAGASIITVHGRQREQKGHLTGLADLSVIRYLREQLPAETVMFANGNVLQHEDLQDCLDATGADAVMSAEANLYDPSIFAEPPPVGEEGREYWRGRDGKGGYRADAVLRRYLDIIYKYTLGQEPPVREPLFVMSDLESQSTLNEFSKRAASADADESANPAKKAKLAEGEKRKKKEKCTNPNLTAMQPHCFHILRAVVTDHHDVRDCLARCRAGDLEAYEEVLRLTENAVKKGLLAYAADPAPFEDSTQENDIPDSNGDADPSLDSHEAVRRCKRPFWVCQSKVRPLPKEALEKGSIALSKKDIARLSAEKAEKERVGLSPNGKIESVSVEKSDTSTKEGADAAETAEVPREGVVCG